MDLEDPRPGRFQNLVGYNDFVRSCVVNYVANSGEDICMRYLYPSADMQAAAIDHDYLSLPLTELLVDRANAVTHDGAAKIESSTRKQTKSGIWRDERRWRLTASMFGTICKITSRRNREKLCSSLLFPCDLTTAPVLHGRRCESLAIEQFEEKEGVNVKPCGLFIRPDYPYLGASPDGVINIDTIVEVKCPYTGRNEKITPSRNFPFLKSKEDGLALKETHSYYYQVQGQMFLSGAKFCFFVVYTFQDLKYFKVNLDVQYCQESLVPKLEMFYENVFRKYVAKKM